MEPKDKKPRKSPEIVSIGSGKRDMISTQQFNVPLVADKILTDGVSDWYSVIDIAKFAYGKALKDDRRRVRKNIWNVRKELLKRGCLLITEGLPVEHVKIYTGDPVERQYAEVL